MVGDLSASWLTRVTAATLPLYYFDEVITEHEINLGMKRHRH
ncbi:hypothetical protein ACFLVH_00935 [Chloroflexota bacterium]